MAHGHCCFPIAFWLVTRHLSVAFWCRARLGQMSLSLILMKVTTAIWPLLGALVLSAGTTWAQNCSSFQNCSQAVASYKAGNGKLDRDKDGIPCESICGRNGENMPQ